MNVDVSIDSFPATDFGVLEGKVIRVGSDALALDQAVQRNEYDSLPPSDYRLNN